MIKFAKSLKEPTKPTNDGSDGSEEEKEEEEEEEEESENSKESGSRYVNVLAKYQWSERSMQKEGKYQHHYSFPLPLPLSLVLYCVCLFVCLCVCLLFHFLFHVHFMTSLSFLSFCILHFVFCMWIDWWMFIQMIGMRSWKNRSYNGKN